MNKRGFVLSTTASVAALVTLVGVQIAAPSWAGFRSNPKEVVDEAWQIINREYVDGDFNNVDWEQTRRDLLARDYTTEEEAYNAIRDALGELDDPYTRFMDPEQFASMQIDTSGELTGVGIQLGAEEETGRLLVVSPIEDSPAFEAGVQSQDIIIGIDGTDTEGMDVNGAVNLIRGEIGSTVVLTILRGEEEIDFEITRDRIELQAVRYETHNENGDLVGYIRLTQFSANASEKMRAAIKDLEVQGAVAYILDLRGNPGGLLYSSAEIARLFLNEGGIVSTINRQGVQDSISANGRALTDKPLTVLVDGGSASASEILAGALQDNHRAVLVGTQTFGKGLVQSVHALSGDSGLAVTIARYHTPSGRDIDHKGIAPDIVTELSEADLERLSSDRDLVATLADPQYAAAVQNLKLQLASRTAQPQALAGPHNAN
ncbi:carboxyl-terminal processing protease CtpC [Synechococcus sp. PCC 7336]|uniref:carboxyl-terminal processing protease CtpC n=1 Tax=Synechococcus sp. PCC 7336 TaxID=195250 RepID=UPI00034A9C29|nr:carboxyl-terminal processing protease CtpC [Synechococcus sp. PCC 7336]